MNKSSELLKQISSSFIEQILGETKDVIIKLVDENANKYKHLICELPKIAEACEEKGDLSYRKGECPLAEKYYSDTIKLLSFYSSECEDRQDDVETRLLRLDGKKLRMEYHHIIDMYKERNSIISPELMDILNRGVYCGASCKKGGMLFTGINPSFPPNKPIKEFDLPANFLLECQGTPWEPYVDIARTFPEHVVGYIDLFPLRESKQALVERVVPIELKTDLLKHTMRHIWRLSPNLIVHTNKTSRFYWGTDDTHPWMGYKLIPISDERLACKGQLYRIMGRTNAPETIVMDGDPTMELYGSYLFITSFSRPRKVTKVEFEKKRLNPDDVHYIWEKYS